jgi:DNA-binding protein HU-beta
MTTADLITRIAEEATLTKRQSEQVVDALLASVQDALRKGEKMTLVGFGTFSAMSQKARTGRNPRTGQALYLHARKAPKFSAGKKLREAVRVSS